MYTFKSVSSISCVNCTGISSAGLLYSVTSNISLLSVSSIACVNCTDISSADILYSVPPNIKCFKYILCKLNRFI